MADSYSLAAATARSARPLPAAGGSPWLLLLVLVAALALRVFFAAGISGNDDLAIANAALGVLDHGVGVPGGHYAARFGLTLPLALIFRLAGVGVAQLLLLPMAASLAGIALAWWFGTRLFGPPAGLFAALALAVYPMDVEFAGLCFPDLIQGVALAGAVACAIEPDGRRRGAGSALAAGALWAYAYYVKIDAAVLVFVLLLAWALGYLRFFRLVLVGLTALALVGVELAAYAALTGDPFYHVALERRAANETLAAGMDYRQLFTYPKAMFLTVYQTGAHGYLLLAALVLALATRRRGALLLAGWVAIFLAWLMFGVDPFGATVRLKPQIPRYMMDFAVPMAVLVGWLFARARRGLPGWLVGLAGLGTAAVAVVFMAFNGLSYQPAVATRRALAEAVRQDWFPLYTDLQSAAIASFVLHGSPQAAGLHQIQIHDFLAGTTSFGTIAGPRAWLLDNAEFERRLKTRNLVTPIDPAQFGMKVTPVFTVDRPLPAIDYAILHLLVRAADLVPAAGLRAHIHETAEDLLLPGVATVYRLDR
jgi:Dolichyl-phosphate-mannose-protein mannosyltransferase